MRTFVVRGGIAFAMLLFVLSPTVTATAEGMVMYVLGVALIVSVPLALATKRSDRLIAWTLLAACICAALVFWARAVDTLNQDRRLWQQRALDGTGNPSPPAATQPTTRP